MGGWAKGIPINWRTLFTNGFFSPWMKPNDGVLMSNWDEELSPVLTSMDHQINTWIISASPSFEEKKQSR
jgi:hypothetical protein